MQVPMLENTVSGITLLSLLAGVLLVVVWVGLLWKVRANSRAEALDSAKRENEELRSQTQKDAKQLAIFNERVQQIPELETKLEQANQQRETAQSDLKALKVQLELSLIHI